MRGRGGHSGHWGGRGLRLADRGRGLSRVRMALVLLLLWLLLLLLLLLRRLWHTWVRLNHSGSTRARRHPWHLSRSRSVSSHTWHPRSLLLLL